MQTLYVYYKVATAERGDCLTRARAFEKHIQQKWPELQIELMQRPASSAEGLETWMEVYRHPQGVTTEMTQSISQLALEHGLPPKRASEFFVPLKE